jgi:hypothetical protein
MSLKSGKRKLLVEGGARRSNNKDADRGRRSVEKSSGDRGRSLERGTEGGSSSSSRPSVFSRLGTKIQGQVPAQPPARLSGEGMFFFSFFRKVLPYSLPIFLCTFSSVGRSHRHFDMDPDPDLDARIHVSD